MKKVILVLVVIFAATLAFTACKSDKKEVKEEVEVVVEKSEVATKDVYQCPMKCEKEKTYDKEGKCPVCEMKLRKKVTDNHEKEESHEGHNH